MEKELRKKIYISGSISQNKDYRKQFTDKFYELKAQGYTVITPTFIKANLSWKEHMRIDLAMLNVCDCVYMMKGWEQSRGAQIEEFFAQLKGKEIIYEKNCDLEVKIKLLEGGKNPERKTSGAACYDCYSTEDVLLYSGNTKLVKLGFCMELPDGYYAEIRGRSGNSSRGILCHTGIVDSDYRGEVRVILTNLNEKPEPVEIKKGDRVAQMMIKKVTDSDLVLSDELSETFRGDGGFGSTGK